MSSCDQRGEAADRPPLRLRSLLFASAAQPAVLAKLPRSSPDGCVVDLEDAVAPDAKAPARAHARRASEELAEVPGLAVFVRVNAVGTPWFRSDVDEALSPALTGIVVPKLSSPEDLDTVRDTLHRAGLDRLCIVAGIETAAGVARVDSLLRPPVTACYFGAEDFVADMGGVRTTHGREVLYARSRVALAARLAGVHPLDQIVAALRDRDRFIADAEEGRAIGYRGKLCIHPDQVPLANRVFSPDRGEIDRARRLLAAVSEAAERGEGVITFDGEMVDEPMVRRARAVLAAAEELA